MSMPLRRTMPLLLAAISLVTLAAGCQQNKKAANQLPQAAAEERIDTLRAHYSQIEPAIVVGRVAAVNAATTLTAVSVPTDDMPKFNIGMILTFMDIKDGSAVNFGPIIAITKGYLVVRYDDSQGKRAPEANDAVLYLK